VLLMPQGELSLLPLHAAWREVKGVKRAFLDDYTVSYVPSGYALSISHLRWQELRRQERSLLVVINPTTDLAFTSAEGEAIAAFFAPAARKALVEAKATKEAVVQAAPGQTYLHFSCHGFYDWENAMHSGLRLAGNASLTLAEIIAGLDLSTTRLVTLSACETGLTDIRQAPDEYIGLPAGFLQAGAPVVVSSLWAVSDLSTALLMKEFYRLHLYEGHPIAEALRGAQLWLRDATAREMALVDIWQQIYRKSGQPDAQAFQAIRYYRLHPDERPFAHPYYWAAFTASGAA
jgi:CHAT domain-containing protein